MFYHFVHFISVWRQSIIFPSFFRNQNRFGFKKILEIKLLDKSIVSKKDEKNKGKPRSQLNKNFMCKNRNSNLFRKEKTLTTERKSWTEKKASQPRFYPTFPLSWVWNSPKFPTMFYILGTCSDKFLLSVSLLLPILFTSHCSPLLY